MRYQTHDYRFGGYFITFATEGRQQILGKITGSEFKPSSAGKIVIQVWRRLPDYYFNLELDVLQIMPDHVHGILQLHDPVFWGRIVMNANRRSGLSRPRL